MKEITRQDVLQVANRLGLHPTEEQIQEIIAMYPLEQTLDPDATWELVVENCLYTLS